jgi:hypothetical protein
MYVVSATNGQLLGSVMCGMSDVPPALYISPTGGHSVVVHSAGDNLVAPQITAFDATTRAVLWRTNGVGHIATPPVISRDVVYTAVGMYDGWSFLGMSNLTVLSVTDGALVSETGNLQGGQTPAIAGDVLYTANNGVVYAYSWPSQNLNVDVLKAKVKLTKIGRDGMVLKARAQLQDPPTTWANAISIMAGDAELLGTANAQVKTREQSGQIAKVIIKASSTIGVKSATKIKWSAKSRELSIKAKMKQTNLKGQLPYEETDGTTTPDVYTSVKGGDFAFYATSDVTVTSKTKKGKVKMKN